MITVIVGPPCAGKSTYAAEKAIDGDIVVDFDKLATALGSKRPHNATGAVRDVAFKARARVIQEILSGVDTDSWIIHTAPNRESVASYRSAGATFQVIDPGIDECLRRARDDERPEFTAEVIADWYKSPPEIPTSDSPASKRRGFSFAHKEGCMKIKKFKSVPVTRVKAGPDDGLKEGEFIVYPSTFTLEPDSYGDVVAKGAFLEALGEWEESGDVMPGMYLHDPNQIVAAATDFGEDDHGWWVKGEFDDDPQAQRIYKWLKGRRLSSLSFGYQTLEEGKIELPDGKTANELRKVRPLEFSFLPKGFAANPDTSVVAVKALAESVKQGVELSEEQIDSLREASSAIDSVLSSINDQDDDGDEDQEEASGNDERGSDASDDESSKVKSPVSDAQCESGPSVLSLAAKLKLDATMHGGHE